MRKTKPVRGAPDSSRVRSSLLSWYGRTARDLPWRRTNEPYPVWVSEVMLQQTTVAAVLPYYERFIARYPDLRSLADCEEEELLALWSGLGYYRRARNLRSAARTVVERYHGRFPSTLDEIRALPGIGRYSAGAIGSICFGLKAAAVDGNVKRVLARLFAIGSGQASRPGMMPCEKIGSSFDPPRPDGRRPSGSRIQHRAQPSPRAPSVDSAIWRIAEELVPANRSGDWTQALMELGARICRPVSPDCSSCPVSRDCRAFAQGDPERYAVKRRRPKPQVLRASLVAIRRSDKILLVRRPAESLLGGLWELPGTLTNALEDGEAYAVADRPEGRAVKRSASRLMLEGPFRARHRAPERGKASPGVHVSSTGDDRGTAAESLRSALRSALGFEPERLERAGSVRHTITHRSLVIGAWRADSPKRLPARFMTGGSETHRWVEPRDVLSLPMGSASKKALTALGITRAFANGFPP